MVIINALTQVALPVKQLQQLQSKAGAQTRQRGDHDNGRAGNGEDDYNIVETSTTIIIDRDHGPPSWSKSPSCSMDTMDSSAPH